MPTIPDRTVPSSLAERYRVLLDIGHTLTGTLSPEELYRAIYRETARVLEASGFYIALYDAPADLAMVVFYADRGVERRVQLTYRGSESTVIRDGHGTIIGDRVLAHSLMVLGDEDTEMTRSAISAPLRFKGRVIGAISSQSYEPGAYGPEDLELLQGIADVAAVAIENARHVSELEARRQEAERLEEIGLALTRSLDASDVIRRVADALLALMGAEAAHVWLLEGRQGTVAASSGPLALPEGSVWDMEPGFVQDLSDLGRPLLIPDLHASDLVSAEVRRALRARCGMVVPLVVEERLEGALSVEHGTVRPFTTDQVRLARRLASQASAALANARLHQRLQALSLTDPLTGLPNRRHLQMHLERELAAARRGRPLTVVIFDLDRFKEYNDSRGHVAGDEALRRVGRVLSREARAMNVVARYGGDEFVSVLAGSTQEEGLQHAKRISDAVRRDPLLSGNGITLTFGISTFDRSMTTVEDIIRAADTGLYQAKGDRPSRGSEVVRG